MLERAIRRKDRFMNEEETVALLEAGEFGVLATVDEQGWPYATPLSYVYRDGLIYFHCAPTGHKTSNLAFSGKVSFVVVGGTKPVYKHGYTTLYSSAVVFGTAELLADPDKKTKALTDLAAKYFPGQMDMAPSEITRYFARTDVYVIRPERITGKANKQD
jgi:nitroimidazol reductase NimA-like FMN-containing flavoprotein (pyridoxamine 5'-phosphate oxidase superfamily)